MGIKCSPIEFINNNHNERNTDIFDKKLKKRRNSIFKIELSNLTIKTRQSKATTSSSSTSSSTSSSPLISHHSLSPINCNDQRISSLSPLSSFLHGSSEGRLSQQFLASSAIFFHDTAEYSDYLRVLVARTAIKKTSHLYYFLDVQLGSSSWTVEHRFSGYRKLHKTLKEYLIHLSINCTSCANILQHMEGMKFQKCYVKLFLCNKTVVKRIALIREFIHIVVLSLNKLRQRSISSASSIHTCNADLYRTRYISAVEEFLQLHYKRYSGFLAEKGICDTA